MCGGSSFYSLSFLLAVYSAIGLRGEALDPFFAPVGWWWGYTSLR